MKGRLLRLAAVPALVVAASPAAAPPAASAADLTVPRGTRATAGTAGPVPIATVQAEDLALPPGAGQVQSHGSASGGAELLIWANATATGNLQAPRAAAGLRVLWRGDQCQGAPVATIDVDGRRIAATAVTSSGFTTFSVAGTWAAGNHRVAIGFTNDLQSGCDRNLRVDEVAFTAPATTPAPAPPPTNPLAGVRFWVDPDSDAGREAARNSGAVAAAYRKIADQPSTVWIGDWNRTQDVRRRVADVVRAATSTGTVPVIALYAVPGRDCGNYSAGGLAGASAYAAWIREVGEGLGDSRAVVVLEPDALAQLDCLSEADRRTRTAILRDAVDVLAGAPGAVTYLDAGTSRWVPADIMAQRLQEAGVGRARGFALNVSNFGTTEQEAAYGSRLSTQLGGKPFVIDTSRNGNGSDGAWCNPRGRALGTAPTTSTGRPGVDAFLWVKRVGESDGDCGRGEPAAGTWWPDHALGLATRAAW